MSEQTAFNWVRPHNAARVLAESTPPVFLVHLVCCGKGMGAEVFGTWADADEFRACYVDVEGHERQGIVERLDVIPSIPNQPVSAPEDLP